MTEANDIEAVRAEALRKLGRNIVNFSKIEGLLKYVLSANNLESTAPKTFKEALPDNQKRLSKQSMGRLVQEFHKTTLVNDIGSEFNAELPNADMSFQFRVSSESKDLLKEQKQALLAIVAERNRLIHPPVP